MSDKEKYWSVIDAINNDVFINPDNWLVNAFIEVEELLRVDRAGF